MFLLGMDISRPMIEYAKNMYHDEERLSFQLLDIETMDLPKDTFDQFNNVLSFYCLHWCQNFRYFFFFLTISSSSIFLICRWNLLQCLARSNSSGKHSTIFTNCCGQEEKDCLCCFRGTTVSTSTKNCTRILDIGHICR